MVAAQQAGWRRSRAGSVLLAGWCRQAGRATGRHQDRVGNGPCEKNVDFLRIGEFGKHLKEERVYRFGFGEVNYFMAERFTKRTEERPRKPLLQFWIELCREKK
jgi:hypothetical protein